MELLALFLVFLVLAFGVPMYRMLTGKGANNWRRLLKVDLAALLVITAGCAAALAIVRRLELGTALCLLTILLPLSLCFAWLTRYALEDMLSRRRKHVKDEADLSFLERDEQGPPDVVSAEVVEDSPRPQDA